MTIGTETQENENRLLGYEERAILGQISTGEVPYSQRAQALLAIDEGATQAAAGRQAGLTKGQVRYWLAKFRRDRIAIFSEELLDPVRQEDTGLPQRTEESEQDLPDVEETAGSVDEAAAQIEKAPKAKKKPKKKSKKAKKPKKDKKKKQDKKTKKGKQPKKKKSKKKRKK